jgi:hypothetical protein
MGSGRPITSRSPFEMLQRRTSVSKRHFGNTKRGRRDLRVNRTQNGAICGRALPLVDEFGHATILSAGECPKRGQVLGAWSAADDAAGHSKGGGWGRSGLIAWFRGEVCVWGCDLWPKRQHRLEPARNRDIRQTKQNDRKGWRERRRRRRRRRRWRRRWRWMVADL